MLHLQFLSSFSLSSALYYSFDFAAIALASQKLYWRMNNYIRSDYYKILQIKAILIMKHFFMVFTRIQTSLSAQHHSEYRTNICLWNRKWDPNKKQIHYKQFHFHGICIDNNRKPSGESFIHNKWVFISGQKKRKEEEGEDQTKDTLIVQTLSVVALSLMRNEFAYSETNELFAGYHHSVCVIWHRI